MSRIKNIAETAEEELEEYLEHQSWSCNPFAHPVTSEEYVLPGKAEIADVAAHLRSYTGPVLIHSRYSGIGKTTLLRMLLEDYNENHQTTYIAEHNVTPYELVSIVADNIGIGKSSSTKLTERKIRNQLTRYDGQSHLIGIDEFGLNDPDTLHVIQFLNDLDRIKIILTGMSSQWEAISQLGSDGRAFQRRVSYQLELTPFSRDQTTELVRRRLAAASQWDFEDEAVPVEVVDTAPFDEEALDIVHEQAQGVPAVITDACAQLVDLAAYRHARGHSDSVTPELAQTINYADPEVESASHRRQSDTEEESL